MIRFPLQWIYFIIAFFRYFSLPLENLLSSVLNRWTFFHPVTPIFAIFCQTVNHSLSGCSFLWRRCKENRQTRVQMWTFKGLFCFSTSWEMHYAETHDRAIFLSMNSSKVPCHYVSPLFLFSNCHHDSPIFPATPPSVLPFASVICTSSSSLVCPSDIPPLEEAHAFEVSAISVSLPFQRFIDMR